MSVLLQDQKSNSIFLSSLPTLSYTVYILYYIQLAER